MSFPAFFEEVPRITLRDPLAEFLGAAVGGRIEYGYADAVRTAGHSCPTVAAAWLMTVAGLKALYGDMLPERGDIRVEFSAAQESGVTGVMASIATLLTGAAGAGGFKGLAGRFSRRERLHFGIAGAGEMRLTRDDTGAGVACRIELAAVAPDPRLPMLLSALLASEADAEAARLFGELWQDRVRRILLAPPERRLVSISPL